MTAAKTYAHRGVVPTIPYRDPPKMIDWLCKAFGFQKQLVLSDASGSITYAQLVFSSSVVMIVPAGHGTFENLLVHPDQVGGVETQSTYLLVDDVQEHHAQATKAGGEIIFDMEFENVAGRGYACRDPEGHIWLFGSYNPWQATDPADRTAADAQPADLPSADRQSADQQVARRPADGGIKVRAPMLAALVLANLALVGWMGWQLWDRHVPFASIWHADQGKDDPATALDALPLARRIAERRVSELADRLAKEGAAHANEMRASKEARDALSRDVAAKDDEARQAKRQLEQERNARAALERTGKEAAARLERERADRATADLAAKDTLQQLSRERAARAGTERQAQEAVGQLLQERSARAAAELAANELRNQLLSLQGAAGLPNLTELRDQLLAERSARDALERAAQETREQLARERILRDTAERALQRAQDAQAAAPASCWSCPAGAACERPN
jgi:uncharacterized glyoxalase superfamily protein PhnB